LAIRLVKAAAFSVLTVVILVAAVVAFLLWRLTSGPVELGFLTTRIQNQINSQLQSGKVAIQRTVLETDADRWIPTLRFVNVTFSDKDGNAIAQLPRVAVTLDREKLLSGVIAPSSVEMTSAKLNVTRKFDGSVELGIADAATAPDGQTVDFNQSGGSALGQDDKNDRLNSVLGEFNLVKALNDAMADPRLESLQTFTVGKSQVSLYDEVNDARWYAPKAELVLSRNGNSLVLETTASVATAQAPWKAKLTATYQAGKPRIQFTTEISDFIPADAARKIFALSQLAKVQNPVSGVVHFELDQNGLLQSADAEYKLGKGNISFPDYFVRPLAVEEGDLQLVYDPAANTFRISKSSLLVFGSRVQLSGDLAPLRDPDQKLTAIAINLKSVNSSSEPALVDNIEFRGKASIEEQRLDIDDFVILQGQTGVRLRGIIRGGDLSPGLQFAGRLRDVNANLLKQLWPPILTPKTRAWVDEHVQSGKISEGTFQVNLPPNSLASAQESKTFAPGSVDLSFTMAGVTTSYFKGLAPMTNASGHATLKDNDFDLTLEGAAIAVLGGNVIDLRHGTFQARQLMSDPVTGIFSFDAGGSLPALVGFAGQPDLKNLNIDTTQIPALDGHVTATIGLTFPMIKDVPKEMVKFDTKISVSQVVKSDVVNGIDLSEGAFDIGVTETEVTATGTAKLNGVPSKINWSKPRKGGEGLTVVETRIDKSTQQRMGLKLEDFMDGAIPVKITAHGGLQGNADVEADLSTVAMKISALGWDRAATRGTSLSFTVNAKTDGSKSLQNITLKGPNILIEGDAEIDSKNGFSSAKFSRVRLSDELSFSAQIKPGSDSVAITIAGDSFDARPYIKSAISPGDSASNFGSKANYVIKADIGKVYANRGEVLQNVKATLSTSGGRLRSADMAGAFLNGQAISFSMTPYDGGREMKVSSLDGGATLRAANFYSKVAGGKLEFSAQIADLPGSPIRSGQLEIRQFEVRNEAALAELDARGKPKKSGPRRGGILFKRLTLPFTTDQGFFRLNDVELRGNDMGMVAKGTVRKADGAICVTGTMIPAQGINGGFIDNVPLFGQILTGGRGEGIFGITFALGGTIGNPKYQVNPLSALAPGFLRKFFEFQLPKSKCGSAVVAPSAPGTVDSTY
jgi:hypothetical protein